ncbi:MAG: hypothetical protein QGF59_27785, partial [Pirellulaceae bacterium]|nr:hypothetical protein [Pirellulaceae bacterium]
MIETLLQPRRLFLAAYFLLWPPYLCLVSYQSTVPNVFGMWSWHCFAVITFYTAVIVAMGYVLLQWGKPNLIDLENIWRRTREHRVVCYIALFLSWMVWWVLLIGTLIVIPNKIVVAIIFADFALVLILCQFAIAIAGLDNRQRSTLGARVLLSGASLILCVIFVELMGNVAGIEPVDNWSVNQPNLRASVHNLEFDHQVITNAQGLRHERNIEPDHDGTFRVVVIGDSMTFGWGVEREETFCHVAEETLRRTYGYPDV